MDFYGEFVFKYFNKTKIYRMHWNILRTMIFNWIYCLAFFLQFSDDKAEANFAFYIMWIKRTHFGYENIYDVLPTGE